MVKKIFLVLAALVLQSNVGVSATFRNLGFDDGPFVPGAREGSSDEFLPAWNLSGDRPIRDVRIDLFPTGYDLTILYSTNVQNATGIFLPAEGRYALTLVPNHGTEAAPYTLQQTGEIPRGSEAIHFKNFWGGRFTLSLNDTSIPLVYVPRPTEGPVEFPGFQMYDVYGDISAYAGQTTDLKLTTISGEPFFGYGIDSISFLVPEPPPWILMAFGGIVFVFCLGRFRCSPPGAAFHKY